MKGLQLERVKSTTVKDSSHFHPQDRKSLDNGKAYIQLKLFENNSSTFVFINHYLIFLKPTSEDKRRGL